VALAPFAAISLATDGARDPAGGEHAPTVEQGGPVLTYLVVAVLLVLLGTGVAARRSKRRFIEAGDAFRCRLRACGGTPASWPRLTGRWSRRMWARWDGDVLVVRRGPVFARAMVLRATVSRVGVYVLPVRDTRGRGRAIAVGLRLCDDSRVDVAAAEQTRVALVGPYLAAAINDLPRAPVPRRRT
jgi:hypothetical protein